MRGTRVWQGGRWGGAGGMLGCRGDGGARRVGEEGWVGVRWGKHAGVQVGVV